MLDCYKEGDIVKAPRILHEIDRGGNGTVYKCDIIDYQCPGPRQLACKKEHKVCVHPYVLGLKQISYFIIRIFFKLTNGVTNYSLRTL